MINRKMRIGRLYKEMHNMKVKPPVGITCRPRVEDVFDHLVARMQGPEGTPYEKGTFTLDINIPEKYPMEPPHVKFLTPIYHPNIDKAGRICMNMLKTTSDGWLPVISLEYLLVSIQHLLSQPNPDDPLDKEIALEYKYDNESFLFNAKRYTEEHAMNCTRHLDAEPGEEKTAHHD